LLLFVGGPRIEWSFFSSFVAAHKKVPSQVAKWNV